MSSTRPIATNSGAERSALPAVWEDLCGALSRASQRVVGEGVPDSPRDRAEGFRYLTRLLAAGTVVCIEHADPDYPEFGRMIDRTMTWGLDCPDCLYLYATVRGDATYRIFGSRGSANHLDIQVNYGHFASGDVASWGTIASTSGRELAVDADGRFELTLSPEPAGAAGKDQLRLAPNAEFVLVRQYFNDWENECPADLAIERVGATYPVPPPRPEQIAARLERLCMWLERSGALWEKMSRGYLGMPPNTLAVHVTQESNEHAGMRGQAYGMGNFHCAPDEAVLVEFRPPICLHWSVSLANFFWESIDFATRQSSLNGHQAHLDADGVFRAVIAHEDPGVPNWLDASGHLRGSLAARFLLPESPPEPALRCVKLADVRAELPADTPRVDAAARAALLERRRRAVWRRYRR